MMSRGMTALMLLVCGRAFAADTLVLRGGQRLDVIVVEETWKEVKYKMLDGNSTPQAHPQDSIDRVEYADDPSMGFQNYKTALISYERGNFAAAMDQFQKAREFVKARWLEQYIPFYIGDCHFRVGNYDEAGKTFEALIAKFPDGKFSPAAVEMLGRCSFQLKEWDKATAQFDRLKPYGAKYRLLGDIGKADVQGVQGRWKEKDSALSRVVADPDMVKFPELLLQVNLKRAETALATEDFPRATGLFQDVIGKVVTDGKKDLAGVAYNGLGDAFYKAKDYSAALKAYLHVALLYSGNPEVAGPATLQAARSCRYLGEQDATRKDMYHAWARRLFAEVSATYENQPELGRSAEKELRALSQP